MRVDVAWRPMIRLISVVVFCGLGLVMILVRNVDPYYARPVQSTPARRVATGVMFMLFGAVIALGAVARIGT